MLAVDIALGVAGGFVIFGAIKGLVELPGQIAAKRTHERHHKEALEAILAVADRAEAAAKEAMAKKPRRKPATKKVVAKKPVAKKGATNVKAKARR